MGRAIGEETGGGKNGHRVTYRGEITENRNRTLAKGVNSRETERVLAKEPSGH